MLEQSTACSILRRPNYHHYLKLRLNARTDIGNERKLEYLLAQHKLVNIHKNQSLRPMKSLMKLPKNGSN